VAADRAVMSGAGRPSAAAELARELAVHILVLVHELLPGGKRSGNWWRVGSLAGEAGESLVVTLRGAWQGRWKDYALDVRGDALDLVAQVLFYGDVRKAMDWARQWLGHSERKRDRGVRRPVPVHTPEDDTKTGKIAEEKIWRPAKLLIRGDYVDRYLRESRGIYLERLAEVNGGKLPSTLRFHPRVLHAETKRWYPAMVAQILSPDGQFLAVHRTYLCERDGRVDKAPVGKSAKKTLGHFTDQGGCIRLWRPNWDEATEEDTLALSEGIEDGLTGALLYPSWRVAAGGSAYGLEKIQIPPVFSRIVLITQNDKQGSFAARLRDRLHRENREVQLLNVPRKVKDLNELLVKFGKSRNVDTVGERAAGAD
jgi:hypothetical protein